MQVIVTVPAYGKLQDVAADPVVEGVRLNTNLPLTGASLEDLLASIKAQVGSKDVWIDLKGRQLRIADYTVRVGNAGEVHYLTLSHKIKVRTPTDVWVENGEYVGRIQSVENDKTLVIPGCAQKGEGLPLPSKTTLGIRPGMAVNILDPSLVIDGYFTDKDIAYIKAAKKVGLNKYMLSFVEQASDINDLRALDADAIIIAKIESKRGMSFVQGDYKKFSDVHLMAARGDLYIEVSKPDQVIDACEEIVKADPQAVLASRILESLKDVDKMPKCQDLFDVYGGMLMGYRRFMIGDEVCTKKVSVKSALGLFDCIAQKFDRFHKTTGSKPVKKGLLGRLFGSRSQSAEIEGDLT